jgi:FdhE protein
VHCGEEDQARLGYHRSPAYPHIRLDTCDACRHYVKTVDLTVLGLADPLADDVASGALDLWAVENGYEKIERNLVGL